MQILLLFAVMLLNLAISFWDGFAAGTVFRESRGWMKVIAWSALIMSVMGFLIFFAIVYGFIATSAGWITTEQFEVLVNLTYIFAIFPVLGAGLNLTIHSAVVAYRNRDFTSVGTAAWNIFAQAHNTYDAFEHVPEAFAKVMEYFGPKKDDDPKAVLGKIAILLIFLAALVSAVGMTAFAFHLGQKRSLAVQLAERRGDQLQRARA